MRCPRTFSTVMILPLSTTLLLGGCGTSSKSTKETQPAGKAAVPAPALNQLPRDEFNRLAAEQDLPLFWTADANNNNEPEPAELAVQWRIATVNPADWLVDGKHTPAFLSAYQALVDLKAKGPTAPADAQESARRAAVRKELSQGKSILLSTNLTTASAEDKAIVGHVLEAAALVEKIHMRQLGSLGLDKDIPADDVASKALFQRNQGPWCAAPETETDPNCNALPSRPKRISGVYPADIQQDPKFCATLEGHKDQKALLDPFVVVIKDASGNLQAQPYTVAFKEEMEAVNKSLVAAANAVQSPNEAAFKAYLTAAAQAFLDNNWTPADEAWAKMNAANSRWYLRIGPDEVQWDPCNRKGGFHVSFASINQASVKWQTTLDPVKNDMEKEMATVAGAPYKARKVSFHLPDFIDIIVNAGDSRDPMGATLGQSLPNWGPVANEGRGRTVVMTNIYTDPDSKRVLQAQTESLFCKESMAHFTTEDEPGLMSTVLHEAAHNLGPSHEYKVKGKTDSEVFGGALATTMEELKAQTAALYFTDWLVTKKIIENRAAVQSHMRDIVWGFSHISRGMYGENKKPKPYSQLASIQTGIMLKEGVLEWKAEEMAANGTDKGCFQLHADKLEPTIKKIAKQSFGIKARGDKKAAEALVAEYVDGEAVWKDLRKVIAERWLRSPKASFIYSVQM